MLREALTLERLQAMSPGEASACFVNRAADGLSPSEQALLKEWLAADPSHHAAFERASASWRAFDDAQGDELLDAMRRHALAGQRPAPFWRSPALAAVASLLLVVTVTLIYLTPSRRAEPGPRTEAVVAWSTYRAGAHEVRNVALSDGSTIILDAGSAARVRFAGLERSVSLDTGRAVFNVAKDPRRPFAVTAGDREVVALGTRFEVDRRHTGLRVSLFRGKVAIRTRVVGDQATLLHAGQQFVDEDGAVSVRELSGPEEMPGWAEGMLDFNDVPLAEAVAEVNRYSSVRLVIGDHQAATMRVSGQFRAGEAERFASTLAEAYPVTLSRRGEQIVITARR